MVALANKPLGSIIIIGGMEFVLVGYGENGKPATLVKRAPVSARPFDTSNKAYLNLNTTNVAYWLNSEGGPEGGFLTSFSTLEKGVLVYKIHQPHTSQWPLGTSLAVSLRVAIPGRWDIQTYHNNAVIDGAMLFSGDEWTSTTEGETLLLWQRSQAMSYPNKPSDSYLVRPEIYLPNDLDIKSDGRINFNTPPSGTTIPTQSTQKNTSVAVNLANYFSDADGNSLTYSASSASAGIATTSVTGSTLTINGVSAGSTTITVTANDGQATTSRTFTVNIVNSVPTVAITSPSANQTLYENDVFNIVGTVSDVDSGNSVTVRYQINANIVRAIKAFVSDGSTVEAFSKTITFKSGSLYDGDTLIASGLTDGTAHTLKVWATDDQVGTSVIAERTFYSVPNRAPSLSINPISTVGTIDNDKFTISGSFNDPDGNQATVRYRINGSNSVQVAAGTSGTFDFDVSFGQLVIGTNNIVVEVQDSMGSKTSKTIKLSKNKIETPLLRSTERYKIVPPTGSTRGVLLWIHRDPNLAIDVAISMGMVGEAESYTPLAVVNSGPSPDFDGVIEDEFYIESDTAKDNIILQIDMTRSSVDVNDSIVLIQGVLE